MNFEIRFTSEAEETYNAVVLQLELRWGDRFVKEFESRVSKIFDVISATPHIYPIAKENAELRKCVAHKNCSMLYKVNIDHILIVYFWDNRQDPVILP